MKALIAALLVLLLLLQVRLWFGDGSVQTYWRLTRDVQSMRDELQRVQGRNQALEAEVADLKSGLEAIEERARTELGMISEDETFYQFVGPGTPQRPTLQPADSAPDTAPPVVAPLADPTGPETLDEDIDSPLQGRIERPVRLDAGN